MRNHLENILEKEGELFLYFYAFGVKMPNKIIFTKSMNKTFSSMPGSRQIGNYLISRQYVRQAKILVRELLAKSNLESICKRKKKWPLKYSKKAKFPMWQMLRESLDKSTF